MKVSQILLFLGSVLFCSAAKLPSPVASASAEEAFEASDEAAAARPVASAASDFDIALQVCPFRSPFGSYTGILTLLGFAGIQQMAS